MSHRLGLPDAGAIICIFTKLSIDVILIYCIFAIKYMNVSIEKRTKRQPLEQNACITPGGMTPATAFAVLSWHVLSTLPDSLGGRENLFRALLCCVPQPVSARGRAKGAGKGGRS
jgi:hypothetical protein